MCDAELESVLEEHARWKARTSDQKLAFDATSKKARPQQSTELHEPSDCAYQGNEGPSDNKQLVGACRRVVGHGCDDSDDPAENCSGPYRHTLQALLRGARFGDGGRVASAKDLDVAILVRTLEQAVAPLNRVPVVLIGMPCPGRAHSAPPWPIRLDRYNTAQMNVIVLPTYNEAQNLRHAIARIREVADGEGLQLHTLIVDDNSPDGTGQLADQLAAEVRDISVMHRQGKQGLGTAYVAGFRRALDMGAQCIFEMDADLSHDARYLPHFLRLIHDGADVVLGSRYVEGGAVRNWTLARKAISRGGCLYAQTILGVPYRDLTGGYKCFRRAVLEAIDLDAVDAKGYAFQIELTYRAHQLGFKIVELPIVFVNRAVGTSKMSNAIALEAARSVWKLRFSKAPVRRST